MSKIYFQGTYGAYSHLASLSIDSKSEIIPCKTFDECFLKASKEDDTKIVIPESNRITGNIGIEYLIFKYRLNIYSEYFQKIEHNLLGQPGAKITDIKNIYSHAQALSQCSKFVQKYNLNEHVRADTAGSAEMVSKNKNKQEAAIASSLSAKIYSLEIIQNNIENEKGNLTRFLVMGKKILQPDLGEKKYITSFLFKLKSKPAALYQSLGGFAINGVNLTKLQSYPETNSFDSFFFLCELDGHIEELKVKKSLEELGLHCEDFHILGVFEADQIRQKNS
ncbi:prephenate dehydratase domain-containing protein [Candidatus Pelagibacter sp.]|jgi:prephenate dehydratase|nr:prephenate dehydratase domain-containing protein [Candidatus Pelagibacter sp.]